MKNLIFRPKHFQNNITTSFHVNYGYYFATLTSKAQIIPSKLINKWMTIMDDMDDNFG